MPYSGSEDKSLPDNVLDLPKKLRETWVEVWNSAYKKCQDEGGKDCEASAFRQANGVIKRMQSETEQSLGEIVVELSRGAKPSFDGIAAGDYEDRFGRSVKIKSTDLPAFVENTRQAISHTTTESGTVVGLPIDARDHDKGDAAGWIIDTFQEGEKIKFVPVWTDLGLELIQRGLRRFFSATIDMANKLIVGGTLTNYPATRSQKGMILLRPIELSEKSEEQMSEPEQIAENEIIEAPGVLPDNVSISLNIPQTNDLERARDELLEQATRAVTQHLQQMEQEFSARLDARVAELETARQIDSFVNLATGDGGARALKIPAKRLKEFLQSLGTIQRAEAQAILGEIVQDGMVEFSEVGHGRQLSIKTKLPEWAVHSLKIALDAGISLSEFFALNAAELGNQEDYDLSEYNHTEVKNG